MIKFLDTLTIIQDQNIVETTVRFSSKNTIEFMNRLPLIQGQKIFGTTVRF